MPKGRETKEKGDAQRAESSSPPESESLEVLPEYRVVWQCTAHSDSKGSQPSGADSEESEGRAD